MKTIEEKNRMIAEFLGCYKYPENSFDNVWSYEIYGHIDFVDDGEYEKHFYLPAEMKFHDSWEWLMPVLKKIRGIEDGMLVERIDFMPNDGIAIHIIGAASIIVDADGSVDGDKVATYEAAVQFIEWYNINK